MQIPKDVLEGLKKLPNLNYAHYTDIEVRVDGRDVRLEADWLKTLQNYVLKQNPNQVGELVDI